MEDWNARQYLKFEDERTRPARDLLAQVPLQNPRLAVDLGCGPSGSTELLVRRFPHAEVIGLDSSPDMLRKARERLPQCAFLEADIASWPGRPARRSVVRQCLVPMDSGSSAGAAAGCSKLCHQAGSSRCRCRTTRGSLRTRCSAKWQQAALGLTIRTSKRRRAAILPAPEVYYDLLKPVCARIDIWHTIYNHVMAAPRAIVEWFKGSALQPYLSPLDDAALREKFLAVYTEKIAAAYKPRFDGKVLLRFSRLFIVAVR